MRAASRKRAQNGIDADGWTIEDFCRTENLMMIGAAGLAPDGPVYSTWQDAILAIASWNRTNR